MPIDANFGCLIDNFLISLCTQDEFRQDIYPKDTKSQIDMLEKIINALHEISLNEGTYNDELYNMVRKLLSNLKKIEKIKTNEWQDNMYDLKRYIVSVDPSYYSDESRKERDSLSIIGIPLDCITKYLCWPA